MIKKLAAALFTGVVLVAAAGCAQPVPDKAETGKKVHQQVKPKIDKAKSSVQPELTGESFLKDPAVFLNGTWELTGSAARLPEKLVIKYPVYNLWEGDNHIHQDSPLHPPVLETDGCYKGVVRSEENGDGYIIGALDWHFCLPGYAHPIFDEHNQALDITKPRFYSPFSGDALYKTD